VVDFLNGQKVGRDTLNSAQVLEYIYTPVTGDEPMQDLSKIKDWLSKPENMSRFTQAMADGYEISELTQKYYTASTWRHTPMVLVFDSSVGEYSSLEENISVTNFLQTEFKQSELPDTILNSPWWIPESEYKETVTN